VLTRQIVFPEPKRRKLSEKLTFRVSPEDLTALKNLAAFMKMPLCSLLGQQAKMTADCFKTFKFGENDFHRFVRVDLSITIESGLNGKSVNANKQFASAPFNAWMQVRERLLKIYDYHEVDLVMDEYQLALKSSINKALKRGFYDDVRRLIQNWERQAKHADRL
jgi:hypothetical protein